MISFSSPYKIHFLPEIAEAVTIRSSMSVFTQPRQNSKHGQFLSTVQMVWIQSFYSRLVAVPRLKNPIYPIIYL